MVSFSSGSGTMDLKRIEAEYIKNLQQQVYFLELEANFLYPFSGVCIDGERTYSPLDIILSRVSVRYGLSEG
jgi:hypothetical protein